MESKKRVEPGTKPTRQKNSSKTGNAKQVDTARATSKITAQDRLHIFTNLMEKRCGERKGGEKPSACRGPTRNSMVAEK